MPLLREPLGAPHIGPSFTWVGYGDTSPFRVGFGTRRVVTFPIQLIGPQSNIPVPANAPIAPPPLNHWNFQEATWVGCCPIM